jgi:diaminopimelate epimerase
MPRPCHPKHFFNELLAVMLELNLYEAAGNRFALYDGRLSGPPADAPRLARESCAPNALRAGWTADGLLVLLRADDLIDGRMLIFNADGSRAEACGNGLRCVAWHLGKNRGGEEFGIETDVGVRRTQLVVQSGDVARIRTDLGRARAFELSVPLPAPLDVLPATRVDIGNPHCVLEVDDEGALDLQRLARMVEAHPDFPNGVNVSVVARRLDAWHVRVHERGVGETEACGTGACAVATALARHGRDEFPMELRLPGDALIVERSPDDTLQLVGPVTHIGRVELALRS